MTFCENVKRLVQYGIETGLVPEVERMYTTNQLLELFEALEEKGMLPGVSQIDFSEEGVISMDYAQRFTVKFAYGADFVYKLSNVNRVIEQLEDNEQGIIDLTVDGRANVIPR